MTFPSQGGHIPTMETQADLPCPWHPHPKPQFWAATFDHQETIPGLLEAPGALRRCPGTWHCPVAPWP